MATSNADLTRAWSPVVAANVDRALLTLAISTAAPLAEVAVAADAVTAPTVRGHLIDADKGATRDLLGDGVIWARVAPESNTATAVLVIT